MDVASRYAEMLTYATTVTRNECGDGVNAVLDALADPQSKCSDEIMRKMFSITFAALKSSSNERLWFNCNVKAGKYRSNTGTYFATLAPGTHTFVVKYKVYEGGLTYTSGTDYAGRSIQVVKLWEYPSPPEPPSIPPPISPPPLPPWPRHGAGVSVQLRYCSASVALRAAIKSWHLCICRAGAELTPASS